MIEVMRLRYTNRNQIKINYKAQFSINSYLKMKLKKKTD